MDTQENLISAITLLSNHKSFKIFVGSTRSNLWLLRHFKHITISNYKLRYKINNGIRQRKNTVHPYRWMKKKFDNTAELLEYLSKKYYDIQYIAIEFTNGWKIKEQPQIEFYFYTNSLEERDELIDKLLHIAGLEVKDKTNLIPNIEYHFKATGEIYPLYDEAFPDEFWTEEQLNQWKKDYEDKQNKDNMEQNPEGISF